MRGSDEPCQMDPEMGQSSTGQTEQAVVVIVQLPAQVHTLVTARQVEQCSCPSRPWFQCAARRSCQTQVSHLCQAPCLGGRPALVAPGPQALAAHLGRGAVALILQLHKRSADVGTAGHPQDSQAVPG